MTFSPIIRRLVVQLPRVFLEIKVPAETFAANAAGERLLFPMGVHVECQVVDLVESLVADVALECLFRAVGKTVVLVIAFLMEPLTAELAYERLKVGVDPHVCVEG